jgi:hypothetical protein
MKIKSVPNLHRIEIEITTDCNLFCYNCDRSCRQAPSKEMMTLSQINKFIEETKGWDWEYITVLGGEPTLHPHFFEILDLIKVARSARTKVQVVTNGLSEIKLPDWVYLKNTRKKSEINKFFSFNLAPIDTDEFKDADFSMGCKITSICGLGLSRHGYYPCGCAAGIDRVFGLDLGIRKWSEVSVEKLIDMNKVFCKLCGHFKSSNRLKDEQISKTWVDEYNKYKVIKPKLSLY